jgi:hypothetical protein
MRYLYLAGMAAVALLTAGQASAACADRIVELERELEEAAELSIATSSAGQGVAGAREAQAEEVVEDSEAEEDVPVAQFQEEGEEREAVEQADEAGDGGRDVLEARALLEEARAQHEAGDDAACETTLSEVEALLEGELGDAAGEEDTGG